MTNDDIDGKNARFATSRRYKRKPGYLILVFFAMAPAYAGNWYPLGFRQLVGHAGENAGTSIAVHQFTTGNNEQVRRLFIGAPNAKVGSIANAGAVYLYTSSAQGWIGYTLTSPSPQSGAHFGTTVAFSNGHLMVGSPDFTDPTYATSGRIDFFADGDVVTPNLTAEGFSTSTGGNLGSAVAIDGDMAIAAKVNASSGSGCIVTYRYDSGSHTWPVFPAQANALRCGSNGIALGSSVAIRQTGASSFRAVAGAPGATQGSAVLAGAAYVYASSTTQTSGGGIVQLAALAAESPTSFDVFGSSVGLDADFVYVGAVARDNGVGRVGSFTVFAPQALPSTAYDTLNEYFPGDPATIGGRCGASLSVDPSNAQFILGCPNSTGSVAGEGTARVNQQAEFLGHTIWFESVLRYGDELSGADALGTSVAIVGDHAFAGAPNANSQGGFQEFIADEIFAGSFE